MNSLSLEAIRTLYDKQHRIPNLGDKAVRSALATLMRHNYEMTSGVIVSAQDLEHETVGSALAQGGIGHVALAETAVIGPYINSAQAVGPANDFEMTIDGETYAYVHNGVGVWLPQATERPAATA